MKTLYLSNNAFGLLNIDLFLKLKSLEHFKLEWFNYASPPLDEL